MLPSWGANVGCWTTNLKHHFPAATVHAFQVHSAVYREYLTRACTFGQLGLSDDAVEPLYCFGDETELSICSATGVTYLATDIPPNHQRRFRHKQTEDRRRFESLKVNVEGAEGRVLAGLNQTLPNCHTGCH